MERRWGQLYCGWTRLDTWPNAVDSRFEIGGTEGTVAIRVFDDGGLIVTAQEYRLVDSLMLELCVDQSEATYSIRFATSINASRPPRPSP